MGVADNRSYKNEYLFNDKNNSIFRSSGATAKDNPSIEVDPQINSTIKENPYRSNVEIEGKEVVLQPDLSALFNAVGKRHSQGGMDVLLKPDSFIFSDFEDLKFSEDDHELFELKQGGKKATNTPADVLKRNVDLKHYNGLVNLLGDPFKDDLAKKSSARMLEKYIGTLGNIAYIQEEKKGMPQGVPDFAKNTAPVYDTGLKDTIMENKQYAKAGGTVNNPYLQRGGYPSPTQAIPSKKSAGPRKDRYTGMMPPYPDTWINYFDKSQNKQYTGPTDVNPTTFYNYPGVLDYMKTLDVINGVDNDLHKADDRVWGYRHQLAYDKFFTPTPPSKVNVPGRTVVKITSPQQVQWPGTSQDTSIAPGDVIGQAQGVKTANWKFTPWQKASHMNDLWNMLNVDKYGAYRQHYNATYTNPALVNPEQAVGDAKSLSNQQIASANVLNPILRNAQASQAYGQALNTIPGIRSQYDNQNVGTVNQFRQYNNQVKNNESLVNSQNDMNYFRDATTAEVNYKNMKDHMKNQALSNLMSDASTNQSLAYKLLTQQNPAYGFDWNTGNFNRNNKSILDASTGDAKSDMYTELAQTIMAKIKRGQNPTPEEVNFMKSLAVGKLNFSSGSDNAPFKKGGRVKNPYK